MIRNQMIWNPDIQHHTCGRKLPGTYCGREWSDGNNWHEPYVEIVDQCPDCKNADADFESLCASLEVSA